MTDRRFPLPWTVEDIGACFVVQDSSGPEAGLFLLRGGARATISGETSH
jgi:hypothetical protein